MALNPLFSVSIDADRTEISLTDVTVYGAPNLVRADCSVFLSAAKVDAEGTETDVETTGDDEDPSTDSSWSHEYTGDGYWKYRWAVIPEYDVATEYDLYDAVVSGSTVYRSKANSNTGQSVSDTTYFETISTPTDLADNKGEPTESQNIESYVYERVFTSNSQWAYGNLIKTNSMNTEADDESVLQDYHLFSLWLNGAITADERTICAQGEIICRRIQSKFL